MTSEFLRGQVQLLFKRCNVLRKHLQLLNNLPKDMSLYVNNLDAELEKLAHDIKLIVEDPDLGVDYLLNNQINTFRRYTEQVNLIEAYPLNLLDQFNQKDLYFYCFAKYFCQQIQYGYEPPLVSTHSNDYFYAFTTANMISLPLCEDEFLLAIPDFVHELGHIFYDKNEEDIFRPFAEVINTYVQEQKQNLANQSSSKAYQDYLNLLKKTWLQEYIIEFSCDIFATYLVGDAYGWSHLRLILQSHSEIYYPSFGEEGTHPSDEARMRAILITLNELGDSQQAQNISQQWQQYKKIVLDSPNEEYAYCYPDNILQKLAQNVINVCDKVGLISYQKQPSQDGNLPFLLQQAWKEFHNNPTEYAEWEEQKVKTLKSMLLPSTSNKPW